MTSPGPQDSPGQPGQGPAEHVERAAAGPDVAAPVFPVNVAVEAPTAVMGNPAPGRRPPSLRRNFVARFTADTYVLATSLAAATITARLLGPSGRGFYASLTLLSVLFAQVFNGGLGEAAIVLPRGGTNQDRAVSATVALVLPLGLVGAVVCALTGAVTLQATTRSQDIALVLAGALVLLNTWSTTFTWFVVSRERLVVVAVLTIFSATVLTGSLYVLVVVLHLEEAGALLASVLGIGVLFPPLFRVLRREGISLRPRWDGEYLRSAARFGATVQFANLLVQMAGRLDLILVYRIAGAAAAGVYSIGLTVGTLVGSVPMATAYASFPRLPKLSDDEARALTASLFRMGMSAAIVCAAVLAALTPFVVTVAFGTEYRAAIGPTLVLIPGGILWSGQWILCRAAAAREVPRPLFASFAATFVTMVALDLVLIAPFGIMGAAWASLTSAAVGFLVAAGYGRRLRWDWRTFVPRVQDLRTMVDTGRDLLKSLNPRRAPNQVETTS